ncbi:MULTISPECIES: ferrochelatase [Prochlorococcus]|uniref:Ferrochelatase n=1 Tax=Prochlorococcus marinus (strain SARG / CCMP1375 / SS120) TaxID=167539 RepID=HEMH_PROMA|nr:MULTISPECIES: ferrochelatase [Prochlorococcus]Q7VD58.1 RecName: Full=Ferrochelatase; AltName: Full=Heme synthase; AltName: Full=Protoheme ferro-lyase [Prochlorococcus marinus subsp. marinus str. CCMP1375]AAP99570.1 HLIP-like domain-containing ferrochelatase [Prochlorococcus marinus subsp. marinus str. CCMP1375]KGG11158.1 Ferrochelatase [Prochlorococcus marinus str. LG]KGG21496.1 Ferrochelatase [Prochlorococcus marinus str. SS2]KGG23159.1 Ferrochelatase [Prochlorococcus marinus str. SS35]KG
MTRVGVLLMNLGGPERIKDVGPFLYNLFSDPEIIRLPLPIFQKPLAWFISTLRSSKSQKAYQAIGGGSPLRRITEQQARELQSALRNRGINATSYVAMRYWHPFTESAVEDIKADNINEVVVLPLYPHFSISTSGSSFRELRRLREVDKEFQKLSIRCIRSWFDNTGYIASMAELIEQEISSCESPNAAHICFTAHGVPKSYVEEAGDPYKDEIQDCALLIIDKVEKSLGFSNSYTLSYQSRVGPEEWLKPYTEEVLEELGANGVKELIVVPISFVSEHIETLQEIDIEYKKIALNNGIINFRRVKALDTYPLFINGLADLVASCLSGPEISLDEAAKLPEKVKLYPQEKWQWGWNNSAEVWNGRVAMFVFIICFFELVIGNGPLHYIGLL